MQRYAIRRVFEGLVTLFLVGTVVFGLVRITGNPIEVMAPPEATPEDVAAMKARYGFDKPVWVQYGIYVKGVLTGNFGPSLRWSDRDAFQVMLSRVPATIWLSGTALVISIIIGVALGVISAVKPESIVDRMGKTVAILGMSMPVFWVGILLILVFAVWLGLLPAAGGVDRGLKHLILPASSMAFFFIGAKMRVTRSSMLDVLESEYVKMVRLKGMSEWIVFWKHALKNASIPLVSLFAVNFARLIVGAVITETIFAWPGIGRLVVDSIFTRDYAVVQAIVLFAAALIVVTNLLVDLSYAYLDPRIRYQ